MDTIKKGDWVQIHKIVLKPEERASHLPEDTKKVPLEMWVKGFALNDGKIGEEIEIKTVTGRIVKGKAIKLNPRYIHDFGDYVPELARIDMQLKELLFGGDCDE